MLLYFFDSRVILVTSVVSVQFIVMASSYNVLLVSSSLSSNVQNINFCFASVDTNISGNASE